MSCKYCGLGSNELKYPSKVRDQTPTPENMHYLQMINNKTTLKKISYYTQIRGQMGVTSRCYCELFCLHSSWIPS